MPLDPQLQGLLDLINAGTPMHEMDAGGARKSFRTLTVDFRQPQQVVPVGSVEETTVAGLPARVYRPDGDRAVPTIALFHGGGFVIGDLDTHDNMARAIARGTDSVVVSVDYRLAPEHRFPAAPQDAIAATKDIAGRLGEFGGSDLLAVAGDSAGGNLSAVVAQHVEQVDAQFLIYPATDVPGDYPSRVENAEGYFLDLPTMTWFMENYLGADGADGTMPEGEKLEDPLLSPLHGDLTGLPPAVIVTAEMDPLRDEGMAYAAALRAAGVPVTAKVLDGMIHGFFDMGTFAPNAQKAIDESIALFADLLDGLQAEAARTA